MAASSSALTTTLIGMLGVVVGAIISNYVNQRIAAKSSRRDLFFKKKVEYFDRVVGCIENNLKLYQTARKQIERNPRRASVEKVLKHLKKNRVKFEIMTSTLYLDTEKFSAGIKNFVRVERKIFFFLDRLKERVNGGLLEGFRQSLHELEELRTGIVSSMRYDLSRD